MQRGSHNEQIENKGMEYKWAQWMSPLSSNVGSRVAIFHIRCRRCGDIVLNSQTDVMTYLLDDAGLGRQVDRPSCCKYCMSNRMPHRHGKFERWLYTLRERVLLSVSQFLCFDCKRTMSVMPDVAEAHHVSCLTYKRSRH